MVPTKYSLPPDYPETGCQEFDLRLTYRKRTTAAGNVEICFGNRWSKLCSGSFGEKELSVACRALGFTLFERSTVSHRFIPTTLTVSAAVFERILNCSGFERHFSECTVGAAPVHEDSNICRDLHIECLGRYVAGFRNHAGIHILVAWAPCCCPGVTAAPPPPFFLMMLPPPALPRILLSPVLHSSTFMVEEHRAATLQCVIDGASYPPVTQLTSRSQSKMRNTLPSDTEASSLKTDKQDQPYSTISYCASSSPYLTTNASLRDSGLYSCSARSGGLLATRSVEVRVKGIYMTSFLQL